MAMMMSMQVAVPILIKFDQRKKTTKGREWLNNKKYRTALTETARSRGWLYRAATSAAEGATWRLTTGYT
ncbi:hypothetical protein ACFX12_033222 [Malus domestica]